MFSGLALVAVPTTVYLCFSCFYRYYRFNEQTRRVHSDYPKSISKWSGAPDNIKAAFMSEDGCKFLFL